MIKNIVFKTIGECNLKCPYCLYMNDLNINWQTKFNPQDLQNVFSKIAKFSKEFSITWHGGEPLLMGIEFYESALREARNHKVKLTNSIQTNGILVDAEWCGFLKKNEFSVGVSIDGNEKSHNKYRPLKIESNTTSYKSAVNAIHLLQRYSIPFGTLTVINSEDNGQEVFEHLLSLGVKEMDFLLPISPQKIEKTKLDKYIKYLISIFDRWFELDDSTINIRYFKGIISSLLGGKANLCTLNNNCNSHITIEPNGDVGMCDVMRLVEKKYYETDLNILTNTIFEIENKVNENIKLNKNNILPNSCDRCNYQRICRGGCPSARYNELDALSETSSYCKLYKSLINHIYKTILSTKETVQ